MKRAPAATKLDAARAQLAALARDKNRRRFHHNWDKAIAALLRAGRGAERKVALYEAAQARYVLYRWSADESDREEALGLATRAGRLGVPEARTLAAAIRREAGDDHPPPARKKGRAKDAVAQAAPAPAPEPEEEDASEPALESVVNALSQAAPATAPEGASGPARVTEVKAWTSPDYTRAVVYLSRWVRWQQTELPAAGDQRRRLAVDLSPARLEGRMLERAVGGGGLARVRAAQHAPDTVRVVLDLDGDDRVHVFQMDDPPRLVLDLAAPAPPALAAAPAPAPAVLDVIPAPAQAPVGAAASPAGPGNGVAEQADAPRPAPPEAESDHLDTAVELPPRARALLEGSAAGEAQPAPARAELAVPSSPNDETETDRAIRRVVVDAGHGGHDPGAIGPTRLREKDVTLAIARALAARLRAAGFEVVLTRDGDRYLALEERTALANTARGDLFVSVHANAHPRRAWSGVETYFLNVTDDRYSRRLAARENGVDLAVAGDLARILTDLDAKASADASQRLAHLVQREVCGGVRARIGDVRDLGVKNALFYVLLGARMPAVLVEAGFISNREEERRLRSRRYQEEIAAGIARAVISFSRQTAQVARQY